VLEETPVSEPDGAPTFIDVFAGCGGLSLGLMRAGWKGLFALEKDTFAFQTIEANFLSEGARFNYAWPAWLDKQAGGVEDFLARYSAHVAALRGKVDLLAGGPPCQGFSSAGRRKLTDPRNSLVDRYLELVDALEPRMVLLENVRGFTYDFKSASGEDKRAGRNFASKLKARLRRNYVVRTTVLRASEFGVPQQRPRFFLVGFRRDYWGNTPPNPFQSVRARCATFLNARGLPAVATAADALSDLEVESNGLIDCPDSKGYQAIKGGEPRTAFQRAMRDGFEGQPSDTRLAKHRPHIVERFGKIIKACQAAGRLNVQLNQAMRDQFGLNKMATRVLDPGKPAPTITSLPDDLLHYKEARTLTVRENARLQTFPDWFCFRGKYTTGGDLRRKQVPRFTQVANAVPPLLAEMFGEALMRIASRARKPGQSSLEQRTALAA